MSRFPITLIGGGIAGLSLGIGLRRAGVETTLIEATTYPRHRVCGEFISGVSEETLRQLGVNDLLDDAEPCQETVWHDREGSFFRSILPVAAKGISRYRLDQRMATRFRDLGGILREGERFPQKEPVEEGYVYASGRPRHVTSPLLGLKGHLAAYPLDGDLEMHLGDGGYIGLSRIEDGRVNACGLFRRRPELKTGDGTALSAYLHACGLADLARRIKLSSPDPTSFLGVSAFQLGFQPAPETGGLRIGDQFSIIGPFTGHGMSMAFQSAALILPHLVQYVRGERSWDDVALESSKGLRRIFQKRMVASQMIHPFLTSKSGQKVFSTLAKNGLLPFSLLYRATR
ncbi:MAG TPA: FAD-dependent monooxygenase [Verrucomicrobiales bacterium]|nr:FAD-dependent monooxygenase [Verrucomicrobiales bacterium]